MKMKQDGGVVWVTMTLAEMISGASLGVIRYHSSSMRNSNLGAGLTEEKRTILDLHVQGALGEICVSSVIDRYSKFSVDTYKDADIGENVQVRTSPQHYHKLRILQNDNPDHYYILVTGTGPVYCVRGWLKGSDGMLDEYAMAPNNRPSAFFVPQSKLNPIAIRKHDTGVPFDDFTVEPADTSGDPKGQSLGSNNDRLWP
jgi:hypothetical protein